MSQRNAEMFHKSLSSMIIA